MADRRVHEPPTLQARAEVVGYPKPVLEAVRDLVREIDLDPELALGAGLMLDAMKGQFVVDARGLGFMGALARLAMVAGEIAVDEKGSNR